MELPRNSIKPKTTHARRILKLLSKYFAPLIVAVLTASAATFTTTQPQPQTVNQGQAASFSVTATGNGTLSYQWQKDGVDIPNATGSTYNIASAQPQNIGYYTCKVTDSVGTITSQQAALNVNGVPFGVWQGLVGYYPFNGNANDASGNGNNGTVTGATLANDRNGIANSAYHFNGTTDSIVFPQQFVFNRAGDATVSIWINMQTLPGLQSTFIYSRTTNTDANRYNAYVINTGALRLDYREQNATLHDLNISAGFITQQNTSKFQHVVFTRVGNAYNLYINGQQINTATDANANIPSSIGWVIGNDPTSNLGISGSLDDVRVYNRALSAAEVGQLYTSEVVPGTVVAWGDNNDGQTTVPVGLSGVAAISGGGNHTVALKSDGTVVAWGAGKTTGVEPEFGQSIIPAGLSGVTAIATGQYHTVALKSDGTVVAWGDNEFGQTTIPAGLSGVTAIASGQHHTVALKSDGTVVAWGYNAHGQTTIPAGLSGVTAIASGFYHTVALKSDGTVVAWGAGKTSTGDFPEFGQAIVPAGLSGVTAIAGGAYFTVALKSDGTVVLWGYNQYDQLIVPVGLSGVTAISGGGHHSVVLKSDGTVVAWGANFSGQATVPAGLSRVTAISAGYAHTVALIAGVNLVDTTPPVVAAHGNVTVQATSAAGAIVNYSAGSATDAVGVTNITYSQNSGTLFPIGTTTVTITARDAVNNVGTRTFNVNVVDTTAPLVDAHEDVTVQAGNATSVVVNYTAGSATDAVGVTSITYSKNSGTTFPLGSTTVTIIARDAANNVGSETFTVTVVKGDLPPIITSQPSMQQGLPLGDTAYFSVGVSGTGLNFQWYKNGKAILGAMSANLVVNGVTTLNSGAYTCKISNTGGSVTTEAVVLSVVDPSLLIYKVSGTEAVNEAAKTTKGAVGGWLVLDRSGQQGAFILTGKQGKRNTYTVERRADLATHSTGPSAKSTTVVVADQTSGEHPDVEHNLVWLRGGDALVKLSAFDQTFAPSVMAGTIGRLTLGDRPMIQTLAVSLVLDKPKSTMSRTNADDMEKAITRITEVLNAAGYLEL